MDMRRGIEGAEAKKRKRKGLEKKKSKIEVLEAAHRAIVRRGGASAVSVEDTMQEMVLGVARKSGSSPTKLKFKAGTVFRAALKKAAQVVEERSSSGSGSWVAGDSLESKSSFRRGRFDEGDSEGGEGSVEIRVRRGAPHSKEGGVSAPDETGSLVSEVTTIMDEDGASHLSDTEFQVGGKRRVVVQPSHLRPITPPMPPPLSDKPEAFRSRSSSGESGEGAPDEVIVEVSDGKKKTSMLSQPQVDEIDSRDVMPRRTIPVTPPPPSSSDG